MYFKNYKSRRRFDLKSKFRIGVYGKGILLEVNFSYTK